MKYKPARPGQWAKKGDRIDSAKKGLWWGSKEEAMQLRSIEKWLQALRPATWGGGNAWQITAQTGGPKQRRRQQHKCRKSFRRKKAKGVICWISLPS